MPAVGYGRGGYGSGPYGWADWAEYILWEAIPEIHRRRDVDQDHQPLRAIIDSVKPLLEDIRIAISEMWKLRDPFEIQIDLLDRLGYDFDQVTDENKSERLRRSAVANAPRLYLTKGTDRGYSVLGGMEGYTTEVISQWESPCRSGYLTDAPPSRWVPSYDELPSDVAAIYDDFLFDMAGLTLLTLRYNAATGIGLTAIGTVTRTNTDVEQTLTTIGTVPATYDLASALPLPTLPVFEGSVTISVRVDGDTLTATDDGAGILSGDALAADGTVDYATGVLTGSTVLIDAGSDVTIVYTRETQLVSGVDYVPDLVGGTLTLVSPSLVGDKIRVHYTVTVPCDLEFPDKYDFFPITLHPVRCTICRTHNLILKVSKEDPTGNIEKLMERVFYYKPIHVEIGLRESFDEPAAGPTELWSDKISLSEAAKQPMDSSAPWIQTVTNYLVIDDTSMGFDEPNYSAVIG